MEAELRSLSQALSDGGVRSRLTEIWASDPVSFDPRCVTVVRGAAQRLGYSHLDIVSGAGHDSVYLSRIAPAAMIFVPCERGISHNEEESARKEDIAAGADVLMTAVLEVAGVSR
jgi:N-carbamoyl-L-amino-acid hydrolase